MYVIVAVVLAALTIWLVVRRLNARHSNTSSGIDSQWHTNMVVSQNNTGGEIMDEDLRLETQRLAVVLEGLVEDTKDLLENMESLAAELDEVLYEGAPESDAGWNTST